LHHAPVRAKLYHKYFTFRRKLCQIYALLYELRKLLLAPSSAQDFDRLNLQDLPCTPALPLAFASGTIVAGGARERRRGRRLEHKKILERELVS